MKRRRFLQYGGAAATWATTRPAEALFGLSPEARYRFLVPELFERTRRPASYTPALVVGSGFGGSIAAYRLSTAGIPVTVLERGSRWPTHPWRDIHSPDTSPDGRAFWHRTRANSVLGLPIQVDDFGGVLDLTEYEHIDVWRAACVGGGSKVFTGAMTQPDRDYFEAVFGQVLSYDQMNAVYYPRVRALLGLSPLPDDLYGGPSFRHSRIWDYQARKAGYTPESVDGCWNWNVVRDEVRGRARASATAGESNHGNGNGCKVDLTQNYLRWAEDSGHVQVYPGMQVRGISRGSDGRYLADVEQLDPMGEVVDRFVLASDCLVLAAGSIGTSELLTKARALGELPNLNEHIGEGWGTNGEAAAVRSLGNLPFDVRNLMDLGDLRRGMRQASPCASRIVDTAHGLPAWLENWFVPLPLDLTLISSLSLVFDQTRARFSYDPTTDRTTLHWPRGGNDDVVAVTRAINARIADAAGATTGVPLLGGDVDASFTSHPLGGAVLGRATDAYGRVEGHPGLYVMDGALIDGSTGGANPALTIAALAERNMEELLATDFAR